VGEDGILFSNEETMPLIKERNASSYIMNALVHISAMI